MVIYFIVNFLHKHPTGRPNVKVDVLESYSFKQFWLLAVNSGSISEALCSERKQKVDPFGRTDAKRTHYLSVYTTLYEINNFTLV